MTKLLPERLPHTSQASENGREGGDERPVHSRQTSASALLIGSANRPARNTSQLRHVEGSRKAAPNSRASLIASRMVKGGALIVAPCRRRCRRAKAACCWRRPPSTQARERAVSARFAARDTCGDRGRSSPCPAPPSRRTTPNATPAAPRV